MSMDLSQYEENYKGPCVVECTGAKIFKTQKGSEGFQLNLKVTAPAEGYDTEQYMDPTGYTLRDTVWMPSNSDEEGKAKGKGARLRKMVVGFGFDGSVLPEPEEFVGLQAIAEIAPDSDGEVGVNFNRYRAL